MITALQEWRRCRQIQHDLRERRHDPAATTALDAELLQLQSSRLLRRARTWRSPVPHDFMAINENGQEIIRARCQPIVDVRIREARRASLRKWGFRIATTAIVAETLRQLIDARFGS